MKWLTLVLTKTRLDIRLHELRRHQRRGMTRVLKSPCPMMRAATGFHADQTDRKLSKEGHDLTSFQGFSQYYMAIIIQWP
jgi:hypothetical protein